MFVQQLASSLQRAHRIFEAERGTRVARGSLDHIVADLCRFPRGDFHALAHIDQNRLWLQFVDVAEPRNAFCAIGLLQIHEQLVAPISRKVHVDIGQVDTRHVHKTLEQQSVLDRIQLGYSEQVTDNRPRRRAASWTNQHSLSRPTNQVVNHQKIRFELLFTNYAQFSL